MSFEWSDYCTLAQQLLDKSSKSPVQEADLRSAISRAYYALFKTAHNYLRDARCDRLLQQKRGGEVRNVHMYVREELSKAPGTSPKKVATQLQMLHEDRKKADYEDVFQGLSAKARFSLEKARETLTLLKQLESL